MFRPDGLVNKGSVMLLLLVSIMIAGIIAARLLPDYSTGIQREKEVELILRLERIRQAMLLESIASSPYINSVYQQIWNVPDNQLELKNQAFNNYLNVLIASGYLPSIPNDPLVPQIRWGTEKGNIFWYPTRNLLSSGSFEVNSFSQTIWQDGGLVNTLATLSNVHWAGEYATLEDSSWIVNRFGSLFTQGGRSLMIISK